MFTTRRCRTTAAVDHQGIPRSVCAATADVSMYRRTGGICRKSAIPQQGLTSNTKGGAILTPPDATRIFR
eukprot:3970621-Pyramimonas_sp.AAC.1